MVLHIVVAQFAWAHPPVEHQVLDVLELCEHETLEVVGVDAPVERGAHDEIWGEPGTERMMAANRRRYVEYPQRPWGTWQC